MRTAVLAGSGRAYELAGLLNAVASPAGVAQGWEITGVPDVRVHVDPDGTVEVTSGTGTALLRGRLAAPAVVAAMVTAGRKAVSA